ncbi:MAG: hypothetical protein ACFFE5_13325 [Candidatus Thorarchaeota archaeon]
MRTKTKVFLVVSMLFLVSTVSFAVQANAVKNGFVVKLHMRGEGEDFWDPNARVVIKGNVEYNYNETWLDNGEFKKIYIDPVSGEETMLCHGRLKGGWAIFLDWWYTPVSGWWQYVWIVGGNGVVKTQTDTYSEAEITLIFCLSGNWAYAQFYDPESGIYGPYGPYHPMGDHGTVTFLANYEEIGLNQFEHGQVLNSFLTGENRITNGIEINTAETNYISVAMGQLASEKEDHLFTRPWSWTMVLDGEELMLNKFWWDDPEGLVIGEPVTWLVLYYIFEPYTLDIGEHTIEHEVSWYDGIGQDRAQSSISWSWTFWVSLW